MFNKAIDAINNAQKIVVVQAENPDGDSIGSSLALEEILSDLGKNVQLHCPVDTPKYLRYIHGWDRITSDFDTSADLAIIVDTNAELLISKSLSMPGVRHFLETHPVIVLDHHATDSTLTFDAIMSDSLGLTTQNTTADSFRVAGELTALGASNSAIEERRREFMKKSPEILAYKGRLIERIEYLLDGKLAIIHIPWEEIQKYSDQYNPSVLVLDEMRLVEGVEVACAIKTYPDGKLTGKLRSNMPVSEQIAGYFGGGGHAYAAGFRVYDDYAVIVRELVEAADKSLRG